MKKTHRKMTKYHVTAKRADQYFLIYYRDVFGEWPYYNNIAYSTLLKAHKNYDRVVSNPNSLYNKLNRPDRQQKGSK